MKVDINKNVYVARATAGIGWRIFNRKTQRNWGNWGNYFKEYPADVLEELNGKKRGEVLGELAKKGFRKNSPIFPIRG